MTCKVAGSGPLLYEVMRTKMLSGSCSSLAYCEERQHTFACKAKSCAHLHEDIPVPILSERVRVQNLILGSVTVAVLVHANELLVRIRLLRILVQVLHVRVGRGGVEVVVELLDVLAMVPLVSSHAEEPLLEDMVPSVPERQREAQTLVVVGDTTEAVLAPTIDTRPGVVVGEVAPCIAVRRVVLADGGLCVCAVKRSLGGGTESKGKKNATHPLPVAQVGPPTLPVSLLAAVLVEAEALRAVVVGAQAVDEPLAEGAGVLIGTWRAIGLRELRRRRAGLGGVGVGDVDRERRRVGVGLCLVVVLDVGAVVLAAEDLRVKLFEMHALLSHVGQSEEETGNRGEEQRAVEP